MFIAIPILSLLTVGSLLVGFTGAIAIQGQRDDASTVDGLTTKALKPATDYSPNAPPRGEPDMKRELQALIKYNCPHGGQIEKRFRWRASYWIADEDLNIKGTYNIEKIAEITNGPNESEFFTHWEHTYCIESINYTCSYLIRAHTYGKINFSSISMYMTEFDSHNADNNPIVHENCVIYGPHTRHTCPSITERTGIQQCAIERITVTIV